MRLRLILPAIATAALALTACSEQHAPDPADTVAIQPTTTAGDLDGHTRQTFEITWAMTSEADRQMFCDSATLLTPEQAAANMRNGANGDDSLNWALMVELLEDECALR